MRTKQTEGKDIRMIQISGHSRNPVKNNLYFRHKVAIEVRKISLTRLYLKVETLIYYKNPHQRCP